MKLTEREIHNQYQALKQTLVEVSSNENAIKSFYNSGQYHSITFLGCGSSYSIAKSMATIGNMALDIPVYALPAGDVWLNYPKYAKQLTGSLFVAISRSGSTSELLNALNAAGNPPAVSIVCVKDSALTKVSGLNIELPWAFDESVCQTRCVTNMYAAGALMLEILAGGSGIKTGLEKAASIGDSFIAKYNKALENLAQKNWDHVVVLADGELDGLAEEAALAFKEISQLPSNYYHILDSRHGPMVLIGPNTLVIAMLTHNDNEYEMNVIRDIVNKEAAVLVCTAKELLIDGVRLNAYIGVDINHTAAGALYISLCQLLAYHKSFVVGCDPDAPEGLTPWIKI